MIVAIVIDQRQSRGPTGGCTTLLYTISCVAVAASPTRRSLLTETANSEQLLMVAAVLHVVSSSRAGRTALF